MVMLVTCWPVLSTKKPVADEVVRKTVTPLLPDATAAPESSLSLTTILLDLVPTSVDDGKVVKTSCVADVDESRMVVVLAVLPSAAATAGVALRFWSTRLTVSLPSGRESMNGVRGTLWTVPET